MPTSEDKSLQQSREILCMHTARYMHFLYSAEDGNAVFFLHFLLFG